MNTTTMKPMIPPRDGAFPWTPLPWDERFRPLSSRKPPKPSPKYVYVIGMEGSPLVKIGHSNDPKGRLATLQTGLPATLTMLWHCEGGGSLERHLHREFKAQRVRGEWFDLTPLGDPAAVVREAVQAVTGPVS